MWRQKGCVYFSGDINGGITVIEVFLGKLTWKDVAKLHHASSSAVAFDASQPMGPSDVNHVEGSRVPGYMKRDIPGGVLK